MKITGGTKIKNKLEPLTNFGTVGGIVYQQNKAVLLTCYHCVYTSGMKWNDTIPIQHQGVDLFTDDDMPVSGTISRCFRTQTVDAAVIYPLGEDSIDEEVFSFEKVTGIIYPAEMKPGKTWLKKYGAKTCDTYGKYQGIRPEYGPVYPGEHLPHILQNLIRVSNSGGQRFADKGDSGAFALSSDNRIAGMIVMVDSNYTYLIQPASIELKLNIKFAL